MLQSLGPINEAFDLRSYTSIPFAIEAFRRLGTSASTFLEDVEENVCFSNEFTELYVGAAVKTRMHQVISVGLNVPVPRAVQQQHSRQANDVPHRHAASGVAPSTRLRVGDPPYLMISRCFVIIQFICSSIIFHMMYQIRTMLPILVIVFLPGEHRIMSPFPPCCPCR